MRIFAKQRCLWVGNVFLWNMEGVLSWESRRQVLALAGGFGKFWTSLHFCFLFYKVDNVNILKNKYYDSVNVTKDVFLHLALCIFMRYHFKTRTSIKT